MQKKVITIVCILIAIISLSSFVFFDKEKRAIQNEKIASIKYFLEQSNLDENSEAFGLVRDRYPGNPNIASIAATGFGITSIPIAIEQKLISKEEGEKRLIKTFDTLLNMETIEGFYYHFVDFNTGKRVWNSEISNIDTAILVSGALSAGEYFGGEVKEKALEIYKRINWEWFVDKSNNQFYMAYDPEYGFSGHWDYYAEQLMMYILGAGSPTYPISKDVYDSFTRSYSKYADGKEFIHSWFGSLFTYQFSHAFIDFRNIKDEQGINWFENSINASLANYKYSKDLKGKYKSLEKGGWGMTACETKDGYDGLQGASPSGSNNKAHKVDGTIPPAGAIGSLVFTEKESLEAIKYFESVSSLKGEYGYKDAINENQNWIANDYIGIDKGISFMMIQNYQDNSIWNIFMKNDYVKQGLEKLGFK